MDRERAQEIAVGLVETWKATHNLVKGIELALMAAHPVWLIEGDGSYWDGRYADARGFTQDVNEACRFARFEDAERVKHWLLKEHAFALRTTHHAWIDPAPAEPAST